MSSTDKPPPALEAIAGAAEAVENRENKKPLAARVAALEDAIARLEPLLEQKEQNAALSKAFSDYIQDLRDEQIFLTGARKAFGVLAFILPILIVILIIAAISHPRSPLLAAPPYAIAIFMVGAISGVVVLVLGVVNGIFKSAMERHKEGFIPPPVQSALELWDRLKGGN